MTLREKLIEADIAPAFINKIEAGHNKLSTVGLKPDEWSEYLEQCRRLASLIVRKLDEGKLEVPDCSEFDNNVIP